MSGKVIFPKPRPPQRLSPEVTVYGEIIFAARAVLDGSVLHARHFDVYVDPPGRQRTAIHQRPRACPEQIEGLRSVLSEARQCASGTAGSSSESRSAL